METNMFNLRTQGRSVDVLAECSRSNPAKIVNRLAVLWNVYQTLKKLLLKPWYWVIQTNYCDLGSGIVVIWEVEVLSIYKEKRNNCCVSEKFDKSGILVKISKT